MNSHTSDDQEIDCEPIEDYVFNVKGYAYKHGISDRKRYQTLTAHGANSKMIDQAPQAKKGEMKAPPLTIMEAELQEPQPERKEMRYLLVGLAFLLNGSPLDIARQPVLRNGKACGINTPTSDELISTCATKVASQSKQGEFSLQPLRVVVLLDKAVAKAARLDYFALVDPVDGLCNNYRINKPNVCFFAEYRDAANTVPKREKSWAHLVNQALGRNTDERQFAHRKATQLTLEIFPLRLSDDEIWLNRWIFTLSAIEELVKQQNTDRIPHVLDEIIMGPLEARHPELYNLNSDVLDGFQDLLDFELQTNMQDSFATTAAEKALELWGITFDHRHLVRIGKTIRVLRLVPGLHYLRTFLVLATSYMQDVENGVRKMQEDDTLVAKVYELAKACGGAQAESLVAIQKKNTVFNILEAAVANQEHYLKQFEEATGSAKDLVLGNDTSRSANLALRMGPTWYAVDQDSKSLAIAQAARAVVDKKQESQRPILEDWSKDLKQLKRILNVLQQRRDMSE